MSERRIITRGPEETRALAATLAPRLRPGAVIALHGDLGSGKTCFVQGLAEALGIERAVNSPTYTLISEYAGRLRLHHVDLYRLRGVADACNIGLEELLAADGVTVIEWAERVAPLLPATTLHIKFQIGARPEERIIVIEKSP